MRRYQSRGLTWTRLGNQVFYEGAGKHLDELRTELDALQKQNAKLEGALNAHSQRELRTRERNTLFKVIIAMAISGYCYNPMSDRNDAISSIKDDLEKNGVALDANTIRKWLKIAVESVFPAKTRRTEFSRPQNGFSPHLRVIHIGLLRLTNDGEGHVYEKIRVQRPALSGCHLYSRPMGLFRSVSPHGGLV